MDCTVEDAPHTPGRRRKGMCDRHYEKARRARLGTPVRPLKKCTICGAPHKARGLCKTHYGEWKRRDRGVPEMHNLHRYVKHKCRCDVCREAHRKYREKRRKELRRQTELSGWNGKHGNEYAYTVARCRCAVCERYHESTLAPKRPVETKRLVIVGRVTHWMPADADFWTCPDCDVRFIKADGAWRAVGSQPRDETSLNPARSRKGA